MNQVLCFKHFQSISCHWPLAKPPENIRKLLIFSGGIEEISGVK